MIQFSELTKPKNKVEKQNKTKTVRVRVTAKEYDMLVKLSNSNAMTISEYLLSKALIVQLEMFAIPKKPTPIEKVTDMQAITVGDILDLQRVGLSLEKIAKSLNDKGFRTAKGLLFTTSNLSKMLQREKSKSIKKVK